MWMIIQYPLKSMKVLVSPSSGHKTLGTQIVFLYDSLQLVDVIVQTRELGAQPYKQVLGLHRNMIGFSFLMNGKITVFQ